MDWEYRVVSCWKRGLMSVMALKVDWLKATCSIISSSISVGRVSMDAGAKLDTVDGVPCADMLDDSNGRV